MELTPGASLGPYKIERALGSGAMGAVYLAYDERLDRRVALKLLTESAGAAAQQRLRREARAIARLNHPNIAALYDVYEQGDIAALVMEYVDGESLSAVVKTGRLSVARTVDIGLQLTDALAYAHREGIIHRDIKPANVMLTREGKVKVLDLGIARIASADSSAETRDQTETAIGAGTPAYMAPERLRSHPADVRTDIYSVGVLLFELVTGRRPYDATDAVSLSVAMGTTPAPRVSTFRPDVPAAFDDVIARAMATDRKARHDSASDLHHALIQVRDHGRVEPFRPAPTPPAPASWLRRIAIAGTVIALLGLVAWIATRHTPVPFVALNLAVPPVINERADQPDLNELGSLLQSTLARNLAQLPGISIVPAARPGASEKQAVVDYVAAIKLGHAPSGIAAEIHLQKADKAVSSGTAQGSARDIIQKVTDEVANELETHVLGRPLTSAERVVLSQMPTQSDEALASYLSGRAILDTSDDTATDEKAASAFQEAIAHDSLFAFAQAGLSQAYSSFNKRAASPDLAKAQQAASAALDLDKKSDQAHLAMALAYQRSKNFGGAVEEARKAVLLTPDSDDAHRILGATLVASDQPGERDAGLAELRAAVALRPTHWINYYALGTNLLFANQPQEAIEPLQAAKLGLPQFESGIVNLGFAYMVVGQWEQAIGNLRRALDLKPDDRSALNNLATSYYWYGASTDDRKKFEQALGLYQQAIARDATSATLQMNLGDAYDALRDKTNGDIAYRKAIALVDSASSSAPDAENEATAAKCEAKLNEFDAAEARAFKAIGLKRTAKVVQKLAVIYALWKKPTQALQKLDEAVTLGFSPVFLRDDPDLKSLKDLPEFKNLISRAQGPR